MEKRDEEMKKLFKCEVKEVPVVAIVMKMEVKKDEKWIKYKWKKIYFKCSRIRNGYN